MSYSYRIETYSKEEEYTEENEDEKGERNEEIFGVKHHRDLENMFQLNILLV